MQFILLLRHQLSHLFAMLDIAIRVLLLLVLAIFLVNSLVLI
jgi:hypothetical protein